MLRIVVRMADHPRPWWDLGARPIAAHRRRLVTCRPIGMPDAALARRRIVALGECRGACGRVARSTTHGRCRDPDRVRTAPRGRVPSPSLTRRVPGRPLLVRRSSRRWRHTVSEDSAATSSIPQEPKRDYASVYAPTPLSARQGGATPQVEPRGVPGTELLGSTRTSDARGHVRD
jgi:hypothetical protein